MSKKNNTESEGKLEQVVSLIIDRSPGILMIIHLGDFLNCITYLYIVIENANYQSNYELNELIEADCKPIMNLFTMIETINLNDNDDFDGKAFLQFAKNEGEIIYFKNGSTLSDIENGVKDYNDILKEKIGEHFKHQMNSFLEIANHWEKENEYTTALYFMHGAIEAGLLWMLGILIGYRTTIPNLSRLIRMTLLITDEVHDLFTSKNLEDESLLQLLGEIYPIENRRLLITKKSDITLLRLKIGALIKIIETSVA